MPTPESKVKDAIKAVLKKHGAYFFMPATYGYGKSGVPDIVACVASRFVAVECKTIGNDPTTLQYKNLQAIADTGGLACICDETSYTALDHMLNTLHNSDDTTSFRYYDLRQETILPKRRANRKT